MLKMYHRNPNSGDSTDYWEESWDDIEFENALNSCLVDPLRNIFDKYIKGNSSILEGGCGKGHWVAYFADRNHKVVGLDFAHRTLAELYDKRENLSLCCGNVNSLPFAENTFDIYYSGGVVEHFENGCQVALSEARRVIRNDGYLLLSVPYYSPLRRTLRRFRRKEWRESEKPEVDKSPVFQDLTYFQYAYTSNEFRRMLAKEGLETIEVFRYSVIWGLYDLNFLINRGNKKKNASIYSQNDQNPSENKGPANGTSYLSFIKKLIIGEDRSNLLNKVTTGFMTWASANMIMFVCRKR